MKTAVIYARDLKSGELKTAVEQTAALEEYAAGNDIRIIRSLSGVHMLSCLAICAGESPDLLLVTELSCLGDGISEILHALKSLNRLGISVFIRSQGIQTLQDGGNTEYVDSVLLPLLFEVALIEKRVVKERMDSGRERYKESGGRLGRPKGSGLSAERLMEKYPGVAEALHENEAGTRKMRISDIAAEEGVSESTVKKVKRRMMWLEIKGDGFDFQNINDEDDSENGSRSRSKD